jgi:predicted esterase
LRSTYAAARLSSVSETRNLKTHSLQTLRTARYCVLAPERGPVREACVLLHGYGQLAEPFLGACAALARPGRVLVAPEALSRFYLRRGTGEVGASWMTKAERASEIGDNLRYLDRLAGELLLEHGRALALHAFGFSQGGATAARWALLGATAVARVTLWGCPFPPDLELARLAPRARGVRFGFVLGDGDTTIERTAFDEGLARLRAHGIEPEVRRFDGGHELEANTLRELDVERE